MEPNRIRQGSLITINIYADSCEYEIGNLYLTILKGEDDNNMEEADNKMIESIENNSIFADENIQNAIINNITSNDHYEISKRFTIFLRYYSFEQEKVLIQKLFDIVKKDDDFIFTNNKS